MGLAVSFVWLVPSQEDNSDPTLLFQSMTVCLIAFGLGVGGECPLAAASASERAMGELQERLTTTSPQQQPKQAERYGYFSQLSRHDSTFDSDTTRECAGG